MTPKTLANPPTPISPPKPHFTSTPESSPCKAGDDALIAHVHSLSPLKRNKKNTMDYSTLVLQTRDTRSQKALLYSKHRMPLLLETEKSHMPIKIARFTYTSEGDKIIINDMTKVSFPSQNEYVFQYQKQPSTLAKPTSIADIMSSCSEWDCITLYGKVVHIGASNVVSSNLQVAEVIFADNSGIIKVDLWEENISKVEVGKVYQISPIQVRVWSNAKKLSTITF